MKSIFYILLILGFNTNLIAEQYALIIAIGNYPEDSGWHKISSNNDIIHLKKAFTAIGVKPENITIITDNNATKKGIIESIENLGINCKSGDKVFIHFSGHGQQIFDINGDEVDLLDEAIVPYDSPLAYKSGVYEGENLISDDQLSDLLYELRIKLSKNGSLLLTLDSCHSGTATRANNQVRGTTKLMAPSSFRESEYFIPENNIGLKSHSQNDLAPMVNLFGSSCRQLNYETIDENDLPVGSFSYSFSKNLIEAKNNYSYKELFDKIRIHMKQIAPWQDPSWEGDINMPIFNNAVQQNSNLFDITELPSNNIAIIECGQLNNVFIGDEVSIFNTNTNTKINTGKVTKSSILSSTVKLEKDINIDKNNSYKAQITKRKYANNFIIINNNLDKSNIWFDLFNDISKSDFIVKSDIKPDFIITDGLDNNVFKILSEDGMLLYDHSTNLNSNKKYSNSTYRTDVINRYNKSLEVLDFQKSKNNSHLDLELLVVDCNNPQKTRSLTPDEKLHHGDCIKFRVTNNGKKTRYFTLFSIDPDHKIIEVIPTREFGYTPQEYFLKKNESFTSNFHIEITTSGLQTFKLITSKKTLNFLSFLESNSTLENDIFSLQMLLLNLHQKYLNHENKEEEQLQNIESQMLFFESVK